MDDEVKNALLAIVRHEGLGATGMTICGFHSNNMEMAMGFVDDGKEAKQNEWINENGDSDTHTHTHTHLLTHSLSHPPTHSLTHLLT